MAGYYFRLPAIPQLTIPQQSALNETKQIALSGGPGTGKSVVSLWRHIINYHKNPVPCVASFLSTYTTTLKVYLAACCSAVKDVSYPNAEVYASQNVGTSLKNSNIIHGRVFKEVIIDEAQDLPNDYYVQIPSPVSYGADDSQILYPKHCSRQEYLRCQFPDNVQYVLDKNFRSTQRIMKFAKQVFPSAYIPMSIIQGLQNNVGEWPILIVTNGDKYEVTNQEQNNAIKQIIDSFKAEDHNIAILVPWQKDVKTFEQVLDGFGYCKGSDYSSYCHEEYYQTGNGCEKLLNVHLTTFKSAKGLEFDTVIIPNFHKYKEICGSYNIGWQNFYVACTRARSNLYLISNDDLPSLHSVTERSAMETHYNSFNDDLPF